MTTIVTQLSYNINEKLRLDETYTTFQKKEASEIPPLKNECPFSSANDRQSWMTPSTSFSLATSSTDSFTSTGSSGSLINFNSKSLIPQSPTRNVKTSPSRKSFKPLLLRPSQQNLRLWSPNEVQSTTLYSITRNNKHEPAKPLSTNPKINKPLDDTNWQKSPFKQPSTNKVNEIFPSIMSCTLHTTKAASPVKATNIKPVPTGLPATKRHCRSVSGSDDTSSKLSTCLNLSITSPKISAWIPTRQSQVWKPIHQLQRSQRSFSLISTNPLSRSHDSSSFTNQSSAGTSPLTPPDSPVPRPASVTVIKHEGGKWSFLSSRCSVPSHLSFSPLSSPSSSNNANNAVMKGQRSTDSRSWACLGLSATKRSLSFSDDFEHRESIQYTPASTPELDRRDMSSLNAQKSNLLRCQSHPTDLNMKKLKTRRRSCYQYRTNHHRPTIDFIKQKQTAFYNNPLSSSSIKQQANMSGSFSKNIQIKEETNICKKYSFSLPSKKLEYDSKSVLSTQTRELMTSPTDDFCKDAGGCSQNTLNEDSFCCKYEDLNVDEIENEIEM